MQQQKGKHSDASQSSVGSDLARSARTARQKPSRKQIRKRGDLQIVQDRVDVTPSILRVLHLYNSTSKRDRKSQSQTEILRSQTGIAFGSLTSTALLQSQIQSMSFQTDSATRSFSSIIKTDEKELDSLIQAPSSFFERSETEEEEYMAMETKTVMPTKTRIILTETSVFYLLDMPSISVEKNTEDGERVEKDNLYYDYLTKGKGRNRKTTNAEIQTAMTLLKSRRTYAEHSKKLNNTTFATTWDLYDTFQTPDKEKKDPTSPVTEMYQIIHNPRFRNCVTVMERILANNVFDRQQKRFRGLTAQDPFRPNVEYRYRLELLWTFKNAATEGHAVTSMHWNPSNKDVLAVGYGKFFYSENKHGAVFCWNIKNPTQPERWYKYNKAVTAVAFSNLDPNFLAVGLYDGQINVLDISENDVKIIYETSSTWSPSHEPIWQLTWMPPDEYHPNEEYLVCATDEGRVCRMSVAKSNELIAHLLMRTVKVEAQVKGIHQPRQCTVSDISISKSPAALVISTHRADPNIYYLGTDEGTIHVCSRNYLNQHIDMFLAHNGPVYSCSFSPFSKKIFLTCGADWCTNIWAENIPEPLITLSKSMVATEGAVWSPENSTIIACIAGNEIILWDLQRRTYLPASVHKSPTNCRNTIIQFTDSGKNLVIGDIEGNVHIFSLEDMPFNPFYQEEMLKQVLKKTLNTRSDLLSQLESIGLLRSQRT